MSKVYTDPENYENIAEAIRDQIGTSDTYRWKKSITSFPSVAAAPTHGTTSSRCAVAVTTDGTWSWVTDDPEGR